MINKKLHIIFVDDETSLGELFGYEFEDEIERNDLQVSFFNSAKKCIAFLGSNDADEMKLIISDINMPEMDGVSMLELIRKNNPDIAVCLCSAYVKQNFSDRIINLNISEYFDKPMDFVKIRKFINHTFNLSISEE